MKFYTGSSRKALVWSTLMRISFYIYIDVCKLAVNVIHTQVDDAGVTQKLLSTGPRLPSPTEEMYSNCELDLLAILYALQKFRLCEIGRQIKVFSGNKLFSCFMSCNLTSDRIVRWSYSCKNITSTSVRA